MRELKKARYTYNILSEVASLDSTFINSKTTSLFVESNTHLQKIYQCPVLSILVLKNSAVQTIKSCATLCNLTIENNRGMQTLKSSSVRNAILFDCHNLKTIVLDKVDIIHLSGLYNIEVIKAPNARHVTLTNIDLNLLPFHLFEAFPSMNTLVLDAVVGFNTEDIYGCNIESLTLRNCDISSFGSLNNVNTITIEDCSELTSISDLKHINTVIVVNCSKLTTVEILSGITTFRIERCNSLQYLFAIEANECNILYCFTLLEVPYLEIQTLVLKYCPFLLKTSVSTSYRSLTLDSCYSFESIAFQGGSANAHIDLRITLIGNTNIYCISEWFARVLTIRDNNTLEEIKQVQNLYEMTISNCSELNAIHNLQASVISIHQAPILETIYEVFCLTEINLIGCESLVSVKTPLAKLISVMINDCINLMITIDASYLTDITLINCGLVIPFNIHPDCVVLVENANQLPDTHTVNASPIVSRVLDIHKSTNLIMDRMYSYLIKQRYQSFIKLMKEKRISDCVICHDNIDISTFTITKCNHVFHTTCMNSWLQIRRICPLCNAEI